ncbi:Alpha/Beta hydrolase protein [Aspergillus avenaceus]|uniref:Alpha/Beta hydrolase protein n=1 Tax=Aspergillus avenaceus TaxID=36643 RepID=A0A5N6TP25_ASPAV|nr:Alpha/Beta hydrolase protein [Aspergillus avenaceus]
MFSLTYLYYKVLAVLIRALFSRGKRITASPDDVVHIQSRDIARSIRAHVYRSAWGPKPAPVLVNFHGSGFVIPMHGSDERFCRQVSQETGYTVLDIQYRLAPENPFPAALHDAEDAVNWVLQRPEEFDLSRLSVSGFSAGGNLALAISSNLFPQNTFRSLVAFYPPVDLYTEPGAKSPPDPAGKPLPAPLARIFDRCYIPGSYDARDPRISPYYASADRFPDRVLMVTAAGDGLAIEAETLAAKINKEPGREVISQRMQGCNHAFDKGTTKGTIPDDAKDKAYSMAIAMLLR